MPIQPTETAPKLPKASTVEEKRKAHPNAYTPWTDQDEKDLAARCGFIDATIGDRYVKHVAEEHQLAQVYLQAAVAQAALGEVDEAEHRLGAILALPLEDLLAMARTVAAYVDSVTMVTGSEFATGRPAESGETESLDERVPPDRALTLRLMSAWSSNDVTSFDALFTAAASDSIGALHARDLFVFALEVTEYRAVPAANPQAMVKALCKAMTKHGPSHFSWDLPQR
ncbi:hypothetical protein [Streptomyces rishiriensis]|uniref:hypothetical protein n=1 Tax=Streptomyces rishiriensis TaxID=68264 RepID=UPI0027D7C1F0|nr:hypothetical protein [Streptomyces rishiriensis]